MADFIPSGDATLGTYSTNFVTVVNANLAAYGLVAADTVIVTTALAAFIPALAAIDPAEAVLRAVVTTKDTARESLVAAVRALAKTIQSKPTVTDASKQAIGITVADTTKTPVAVPTTAPVGQIQQANRLEHIVNFADVTTPTLKAKPAGVRGCQIWIKIGTTPPTSVSELQFLATDTRTPYVAQFDAADAGKTAYYWLRWENTKAETGPWSAAVSATITG